MTHKLIIHVANIDFNPVGVQFTFPAGSGPLMFMGDALDPIDDNRVEGTENVQLTATITAGVGSFIPNGDTATVAIQDDDGKVLPLTFIIESFKIFQYRTRNWI